MGLAERLYEFVRAMPAEKAAEVLDFAEHVKKAATWLPAPAATLTSAFSIRSRPPTTANSTAKNCTTVPVFVDTNIAAYAFGEDTAKRDKARALLASHPTISTQVINGFLNICRVKLKIEVTTRPRLAQEMMAGCDLVTVNPAVVQKAMAIEAQSGLNYWDCLIIAPHFWLAATPSIPRICRIVKLFEGRLTVVNPFPHG